MYIRSLRALLAKEIIPQMTFIGFDARNINTPIYNKGVCSMTNHFIYSFRLGRR